MLLEILLILLAFESLNPQSSVRGDEYYEDYYEYEVEVQDNTQRKRSYTYENKKFNSINMSELFLNLTSEKYDCVLRKNSFILALEPENETVIDMHNVLEQHVQSVKELIRNVQSQANAHLNARKSTLGKSNEKGATNNKQNQETRTHPFNSQDSDGSIATSNTSEAINNSTSNSTFLTKKKLKFREILNQTKTARLEKEREREKIRPKFRLGSDCESLLCSSCKIVVTQLTHFLQRAWQEMEWNEATSPSASSRREFVSAALPSFCGSESIVAPFKDMVADMCWNFENVCPILFYWNHCTSTPFSLLPPIEDAGDKRSAALHLRGREK